MIKLLIIADDFTGALDTGVQFASEGIKTRVLVYNPCEKLIDDEDNDTDVLVIDAETRHLSKEKEYKIIYDIVKKSKEENILSADDDPPLDHPWLAPLITTPIF